MKHELPGNQTGGTDDEPIVTFAGNAINREIQAGLQTNGGLEFCKAMQVLLLPLPEFLSQHRANSSY